MFVCLVFPQDKWHRMNTAAQLCLRLLSSLLALAWVAVPLCQASPCSSLVAGVLYGSFSLRDLFPGPHGLRTGCSWTVENPDPTKYTLYFRFNRHAGFCLAFSPLVLPLDHYLANQTCGQVLPETESVEPCHVPGPHAFLQFDKNFVQLCLAAENKQDSDEVKGPLSAETLDFRLVEVLLINNENSSQFTCGVLCRWFEECLHSGSGRESEGCGITQTGCVCPNAGPPVPILPATPHNHSLDPSASVLLPPTDDCCVTQLHGKNGISNIAPRDVHQGKTSFFLIQTTGCHLMWKVPVYQWLHRLSVKYESFQVTTMKHQGQGCKMYLYIFTFF